MLSCSWSMMWILWSWSEHNNVTTSECSSTFTHNPTSLKILYVSVYHNGVIMHVCVHTVPLAWCQYCIYLVLYRDLLFHNTSAGNVAFVLFFPWLVFQQIWKHCWGLCCFCCLGYEPWGREDGQCHYSNTRVGFWNPCIHTEGLWVLLSIIMSKRLCFQRHRWDVN